MSWRRLWIRRLLTLVTLGWVLWMLWLIFDDDRPFILFVLDENGLGMGDVTVLHEGEVEKITELDGSAELQWAPDGRRYVLIAPGHLQKTVTVAGPPQDSMVVHLRPRTLGGRVTDLNQVPVEGALVSAGQVRTFTDADGVFLLERVEKGEVEVTRPAWIPTSYQWDGGPGDAELTIQPLVIRAAHVSGEVAGDRQKWDAMIRLVQDSELNGVMLDIKDETGQVFYDSQVELVRQVGAMNPQYELAGLADQLERLDIYLVGMDRGLPGSHRRRQRAHHRSVGLLPGRAIPSGTPVFSGSHRFPGPRLRAGSGSGGV